MKLVAKFREVDRSFKAKLGEVRIVSDGGYERGYAEGKAEGIEQGYADGQEKGYTEGYETGKAEGYEEGSAFYNDFWDAFQDRGKRTSYVRAFQDFWHSKNFKPKYNMQPTNAQYMFYGSGIRDLKGILDKCGVTLDLSKCTAFDDWIAWTYITNIPTVDISSATNLRRLFYLAYSVNNVRVIGAKETQNWANAFGENKALTDFRIEGVIGTSFSAGSCPFNYESLQSILAALADKTGGTAQTLTLSSTSKKLLTDADYTTILLKNWRVA